MPSLLGLLIRALMTAWGYFFFILGSVVWGGLGVPLTIVLSRFWPRARDRFNEGTQIALSIFIKLLPIVRLDVDRSRRLANGTRVLVVNHQSLLDSVVMLSLEPRLSGPARGYMFRIPVIRSVLELGGFFLSDTGDPAPLDRMRQGTEETLGHHGTLLFFPEGTRSKTGEIADFHRGAFRMAVEYELPIQPVVIDGLHRVLPPSSLIVRTRCRYPVQVRYLDPIEPPYGKGPQRRIVRELASQVRLSMVEELKELRRERESAGQD